MLIRSSPTLAARATLLVLLTLIAWAIAAGSTITGLKDQADPNVTDLGLYQAIANRVDAGEPYYRAATAEQLSQGFPVEPAVTVRLPTTTLINTSLGETGARSLLFALTVLVVGVALWRFEKASRSRWQWYGAVILLCATLVVPLAPGGTYFSEVWAGLLLTLAALTDPRRHPWVTLVLILSAAAFRELALLAVPAVVVLLWLAGHRRPAVAWCSAAATFAMGYLTIHGGLVSDAVRLLGVEDPTESEGWVRFGGWPLVVDYLRRVTLLNLAPYWLSAVAVPLAVLGLVWRRSHVTTALLAVAAGFLIAFMMIGRTNTAYWGLLYAPLVLPGLAFAPRALRELVLAAFRT